MSGDILAPIVEALAAAGKKGPRPFKLATVTNISGGANVRFDEEGSAGSKKYTRLASYTPVVGHRVLMARAGSSWVILGQVSL
jgi:hypothetical protein